MSKLQQDFTQGSISSHLIKFALPYLLANLLQALYSVADMMIVSWMCGTNSMSGVNIGGQITQMIMMLVSGLTVGGTVLVGQYYGARQAHDRHDAQPAYDNGHSADGDNADRVRRRAAAFEYAGGIVFGGA